MINNNRFIVLLCIWFLSMQCKALNNLNMRMDFVYSGDVAAIPELLRSYDNSFNILPPLGRVKVLTVNLDLQAASLSDIADAVFSQTDGQVSLIYAANNNSLRLNYALRIEAGKDALTEALKWQNGDAPRPVLQADGVVRFPYGEYQPEITCQPLNLCDLELQAGEEVQGVVIGDSLRWNEGDNGIPIIYSGKGEDLAAHLVLKPSQGGLSTSLLITTSKRTYSLRLKSSNTSYIARAGFYYPRELINNFNLAKAQAKSSAKSKDRSVNESNLVAMSKPTFVDVAKLHYSYIIDGDDYSFKPLQVFDDGISVYLRLPDEVDALNLPSICISPVNDDSIKHCELVNFRYVDHFYIIDKLFDHAVLFSGFQDDIQKIIIKRKVKPGFWARLFGA